MKWEHPGKIIAEYLKEHQMSIEELSDKSGICLEQLQDIVTGTGTITPCIAEQLEASIKIPAGLWIRLQQMHDNEKM